ncbi:MAG: cytochrome c [Actinomycetota bacterium]|nr:cytochrome c [Actinomycetota bacterium]
MRVWRITAIALAVVVSACGSSSAVDGPDIPVQDADLVAAGDVLYQANCASCHGADLRGTDLGPSHLSIVYEPGHHGDIAIDFAIRFGSPSHHWPFGDMAPVEGLSDDDIEAVIAFIRESQRLNGFEPYPPD